MTSYTFSPSDIKRLQAEIMAYEPWPREKALLTIHPAILAAGEWATTNETIISKNQLFGIVSVLAHECPHTASDQERVAYTRNQAAGEQGRVTVSPVGRYIKRIFGDAVPDHITEKIVVKARNEGRVEFKVLPPSEIVKAMLETTATSCMTKDEDKNWDEDNHPYRVFEDPAHDWGLAVMIKGGEIASRALVNGNKWVRCYGTPTNGAYSVPCHTLEAWLNEHGYTKCSSWGGCVVKRISTDDGLLGPYLDGSITRGEFGGGDILITRDGAVSFDETNGFAGYESHQDQVQCYDGSWIDESDAVRLHDGTYVHENDASYVDLHGAYYLNEMVVTDYGGHDQLRRDCSRMDTGSEFGEWVLDAEVSQVTFGDSFNCRALTSETIEIDGEIWLETEFEAHKQRQEEEATA